MTETSLIGVDWGTTNVRAFRYGHDGTVVERRQHEAGLLHVAEGAWAETFTAYFDDWVQATSATPVLLCGMVGSQQGWSETPYVECPAASDVLATNLHPISETQHRIVPGMRTTDAAGVPDVMRGEETQLAGLEPQESHVVCLPGTHSKWVKLEDGAVVIFQTFLTGEMYETLSQHSILARTSERGAPDDEAFVRGLDDSGRPGGLLHQVFGVRGLRLFDNLQGIEQPDYLSGLLIGNEVRHALDVLAHDGVVTIVGSEALTCRYITALRRLGRSVEHVDGESAAATGLWRIASQAGLIASP